MSLTQSEFRDVKHKLSKADHGQAVEFLDVLGFNPTADKVFERIREENEPECLVCGEDAGKIKYGETSKGKQRYKCKECERTFVEDRKMPFFNSRHSIKEWKAFFEKMLKGYTLTQLSKFFQISRQTAHEWRHKLLSYIRDIQGAKWLAGRVWADETGVPANDMGRKRPGETGQMAIMTIKDYAGRTVLVPTGPDGGSTADIRQSLNQYIVPESSTLVTDHAGNFEKYCENKPIEHEQNNSKGEKMDMVNWLHSHFKEWLGHFRGVGAEYVRNYCAWFAYIHENDELTPNIST